MWYRGEHAPRTVVRLPPEMRAPKRTPMGGCCAVGVRRAKLFSQCSSFPLSRRPSASVLPLSDWPGAFCLLQWHRVPRPRVVDVKKPPRFPTPGASFVPATSRQQPTRRESPSVRSSPSR